MATAIQKEAGGESTLGKKAVAHVILNRVAHPKFPKSICQVLTHKPAGICQFPWACVKMTIQKVKTETYELAAAVLNRETVDPTNGALFFNTKSDIFNRRVTVEIGNHIFYR